MMLRDLVPFLRRHRRAMLPLMLAILVQAVSYLATPLYYKLIFDRAIGGADVRFLGILALGMAGVYAVMLLAELSQAALSSRLGMRISNDIRLSLLEHLQRLSMDFYARSRTGDLASRFTNDLAAVDRLVTVSLYKIVLNVAVAVLCISALFWLEWRLAAFTLVTVPLLWALPRAFARRASEATYARRQVEAQIHNAVLENLEMQRAIRAFSLQGFFLARFRGQLEMLQSAGARANLLGFLVEKSSNLGLLLGQLVIVGLGALLAIRGLLSAGDLIGFVGLLLNAGGAVSAMTAFLPDVAQAEASLRRIQAVLGEPVRPPPVRRAEVLPAFSRELRFHDVTFGYGSGETQLRDLDFSIRAGESVGLVGRSGAGKSTLLNLLIRFCEPTSGTITLDGRDLGAVSPDALRAQMGIVFQRTFLFDGTVRENIRFGRLEATDAEVEAAARAAEIHDFIRGLPQGYDTAVGELGGRLSGGQQQRLSLARAVLRQPSILLLDEATSALDPVTEADVNATLTRLSRGRTLISVTHRLSSVVGMDRILVLEAGRLVEQGTHQQLLEKRGVYHEMWSRQSSLRLNARATGARLEAKFLGTVPLLQDLPEGLLEVLGERFASQLRREGETVVAEGEVGDTFYVIARGRVEVTRHGTEGERIVRVLEDGDYFGEIALLADAPRTATVRTLERSVFLTLSRDDFWSLVGEAPDVKARLEQAVRQRLPRPPESGATLTEEEAG